jgi:hypothetical protein
LFGGVVDDRQKVFRGFRAFQCLHFISSCLNQANPDSLDILDHRNASVSIDK